MKQLNWIIAAYFAVLILIGVIVTETLPERVIANTPALHTFTEFMGSVVPSIRILGPRAPDSMKEVRTLYLSSLWALLPLEISVIVMVVWMRIAKKRKDASSTKQVGKNSYEFLSRMEPPVPSILSYIGTSLLLGWIVYVLYYWPLPPTSTRGFVLLIDSRLSLGIWGTLMILFLCPLSLILSLAGLCAAGVLTLRKVKSWIGK